MKKSLSSLLLGTLSGMIIYPINLLCNIIPYYNVSPFVFRLIIVVLFVAGSVISVLTLVYKNTSFSQTVLRCLCMFCSFVFTFLINAYIGTVRFLYRFLNIITQSATDNVSGMLSLSFIIVVLTAGLATILVTGTVKISKVVLLKLKGS